MSAAAVAAVVMTLLAAAAVLVSQKAVGQQQCQQALIQWLLALVVLAVARVRQRLAQMGTILRRCQ